MNIAELFKKLSYGELSNLAMSGDGSGEIVEAQKPKLVYYLNESLLRLYSRFVLKEQDVLLGLVDHITFYHLIDKYAESKWPDSGVDYPYIKDLHREPFANDVLKILVVHASNGWQIPLNDNDHPLSVFTPQGNMLQVPRPVTGYSLSVLYQAKHAPLTHEDEDGEIILPDVLHGALRAHIAYQVYSHMNTAESSAKAQEHYNMYESICLDVIDKDMVNSSVSTTNSKFHNRGWI